MYYGKLGRNLLNLSWNLIRDEPRVCQKSLVGLLLIALRVY